MTVASIPRARVLADVVAGGLARDAALVLGGTSLIAASALFSFHVPWTPVPYTLQTLAVLLVGAGLGAVRGGGASLTYLALGMAGVPWFSNHAAGWDFASFGYLVGFAVAGAVVGWLAEHGGDRTPVRTAGTMLIGSIVISAIGVSYLMEYLQVDLSTGLRLGLTPFVIGDLLKIAVAAGVLPLAWRLCRRGARG